jgi:hypothetical protein
MGAAVLCQVPNTNVSSSVAADDFSLIGMNDYIINRRAMSITSLHRPTTSFPDLHGTILRASDHPFPFTVECDTSYIAGVSLKRKYRIWVRRFNIIKLDVMMASRREESFVGRDT